MRFVDDFLLVTGNPATAASIICTLERGVVDYNCSINKDKGGANFKLDEHGQVWLDREGNLKLREYPWDLKGREGGGGGGGFPGIPQD